MKSDKLIRVLMWMFIAVGVMGISVGKTIMGGILMAIGVGIRVTAGGGSFNERNLYDKVVEDAGGLTTGELYELLKEMETPLGRCWKGKIKAVEGDCLVFGPGIFKDYVAIGRKGKGFLIKNSTEMANLTVPEEEAWRCRGILDTEGLEVTPKRYSGFAAYKVMSAALTEDLCRLVTLLAEGRRDVPSSLDEFKLYYANSRDCLYRDESDAEYASVYMTREPLFVRICAPTEEGEETGEELAAVRGDARNEKPGYEVTMSGETYGTIYRENASKSDAYCMECADGRFLMEGFRAVRKGNLSCNYRISLNGEPKAVIAGTARLRFSEKELTENSVICSHDDDFLLVYLAFQEFIMAKNKWLK